MNALTTYTESSRDGVRCVAELKRVEGVKLASWRGAAGGASELWAAPVGANSEHSEGNDQGNDAFLVSTYVSTALLQTSMIIPLPSTTVITTMATMPRLDIVDDWADRLWICDERRS